jgi:hypothetical protein
MWEPDSFNEKLVLGRASQLAFRFNVAVLILKWRDRRYQLIHSSRNQCFFRGGNSNYILE